MNPKTLLKNTVIALFILLMVLLIVTQFLGQPVFVFVETGSMEPTLEPNDGYIAVPYLFSGEVEEGDVILFEAQELGGGELTTHRVVGETDEGYITQGDANPFTDQDGDEPPVSEGQIRSVAIQIDGNLLVVPGLGASVGSVTSSIEWIQSQIFGPVGLDSVDVTTFSLGVLGVGLFLFVFSTFGGSQNSKSGGRSKRGLLQNGLVIIALLTLLVIIPLNASMLLPSGVYQYEIISSTSPTDNEQVIGVGESNEVTYFMQNSGHLPVVVLVEPASEGVEIHDGEQYVPRRSTSNTTVTMHAPNETGSYLRYVREYRYIGVLPHSLIISLHHIHPILAIAAINITVASVIVTIGMLSIGTGRLRLRARSRDLTIDESLRRLIPGVVSKKKTQSPPEVNSRDPIQTWIREREAFDAQTIQPDQPVKQPELSDSNRLTGRELMQVHSTLQEPPTATGVEAPRWSPGTLQEYLREQYDVTYTIPECEQLMERSGLEIE